MTEITYSALLTVQIDITIHKHVIKAHRVHI